MSPAKYGVLALWVAFGSCFLLDPTQSAVMMGRLLFWATAIAHVAEFAMFLGVFREAGGGLVNHFAKTLAFGLFHVRDVRAELGRKGSQ